MLYQSIDKDAFNLIRGLNKSHYNIPEMLIKMICKYWREGAMAKLIKLNRKYYSYHTRRFSRIPKTELSRITCKCVMKSFTYKICVQIDDIFVSIYPSIGQYRIGESEKMIYKEIDEDLLNNPKKYCSIELKLKFFKGASCEINKKHRHENSSVEILIEHRDVFDFSVGRIYMDLNHDIFKKDKHVQVYSWNGTINTWFHVYGDRCVESWEAISFMDGMWTFRH